MNWIASHRRVDRGVTVGYCRVNGFLFAEELVLHSWIFSTGFQHEFDRFSAACDQAETKNSSKTIEVLCLLRLPR